MTTAAAGTPKPGEQSKTAEQIATETAAAAAAAAAGQKTPEQLTAEKATADAAAKAAADAETKRKADEAAAASKAPEKYALTLPETERFDAADVTAFEALARENNWTNEEAQAALVEHIAERDALATRFLEETTADPIYGGANLAETQRLANMALDRVQPKGTPAGDRTRAMLKKTGYGNHIAYVSLLADVGKLMSEDNPATGRAVVGGAPGKDPAAVLYDKTPESS